MYLASLTQSRKAEAHGKLRAHMPTSFFHAMSDISNASLPDQNYELLYAKLNQETARLPWTELLRHYAGGRVITVDDTLDLIEVAARVAIDDKDIVGQWLADGRIARATDEEAKAWLEARMSLWTVVVKPWVLVQQRKQTDTARLH
jgi:hypothetical protein